MSGIPLPIPFIGYFVFTKNYTVGSYTFTDHGYLSETMCFIRPESIPFYALFLAPIVMVISVNLIFFVLVARVIKDSKASGNASDRQQILVSTQTLFQMYIKNCSFELKQKQLQLNLIKTQHFTFTVSRSGSGVSHQMIHSFQRQLKGAVGVMSLLGTGWFFGIFMSIPAPEFQVGMQYLFILLNSTQVNSLHPLNLIILM